jgi:hypothetical protein
VRIIARGGPSSSAAQLPEKPKIIGPTRDGGFFAIILPQNVRYDFAGMVLRAIRLFAAIVLMWLWALPCRGEPTDQAVKLARKRFLEGVSAMDAGKYENARLAFQQAYALRPHPSILRNLGQAEFKVGRYLEAARHLSTFLSDTTFGSADERAAAQKTLALAEAKVGRLVVQVVEGAVVSVDGELAGHSPQGNDPFYVEPGQRVVRIRRDGYETYEGVYTFEGGRTTDLRIDLRPREDGTVVTPTTASSAKEPDPLYPPPFAENDLARTAVVAPADQGAASQPSQSSRPGLAVALATTGGLTVLSAGVWIGFAIQGASLQRDEDRLRAELGTGSCGATMPAPQCDELNHITEQRSTANQVAVIGAVATGVSAAAFLGAWLFWPKSSAGNIGSSLVLPHLSPDRAGIDVIGVLE